jgi:hypothetical protein
MKKIFYEKVGRKYVPVREYDSELLDALPKGTHIIMSYPGGKSTRYNIDPNYAAMIAAGRLAEDAMCTALTKASELRMQRTDRERPLTPEQREAWTHLVEVLGDSAKYLEFASARDIADAGVQAMQEEANKLMQYESVKSAYEHFILMCELTKKHTVDSKD